MTIEERIEKGRKNVEAEMLAQEQEAEKEGERIAKAWDLALADIKSCLPASIHDFVYKPTGNIQPPGYYLTNYVRLDVPRLSPMRIYPDFISSISEGYQGFRHIFKGLGKYPYHVGRYFPDWNEHDDMRCLGVHWDDTRLDDLDVALFMAAEEGANLFLVQAEVERLNAEEEQRRSDKARAKRSPEQQIADAASKLFDLLTAYSEPPY